MGLFDDLIPSGDGGQSFKDGRLHVTVTRSPYSDAIKSIESGGDYSAVGPTHPKMGRALGAYQVMESNVGPWTKEVLGRELTPDEFLKDKEAQDAVFETKFEQARQKYGNPQDAASVWFSGRPLSEAKGRKDSLGTFVEGYVNKFASALNTPTDVSARSRTADGGGDGGMFADLVPAPVEARSPEGDMRPRGQAVADLQRLVGGDVKQTAPAESMTIDFLNQGSAAGQGTTPNVQAHMKNLISDQVFQNELGELQYKDPATGKVVATDQNKQIILRDPSDNRLKVFARTDATDEGRASAAGRLLISGMASGAPTTRAMLPRVAEAAVTPGQEVAQAAQRLDVAVPRAVTSDSMTVQRLGSTIRNIPGAGNPMVRGATQAIDGLGQAADDVTRGFGAGNIQTSGDAVRSGISTYITEKSAETASKLYQAVDDLVDPTVTVPLRNTSRAAEAIIAKRNLAAQTDAGGAVDFVQNALSREEGMTFEGIKLLREYARQMLDKPHLIPANINSRELKTVYDALSADLRVAAATAGGEKGLAAFERANRYYALISERRANLAKIVGASGDAPAEAIFSRLLAKAGSSSRADAKTLLEVRRSMPASDWNEFVSSVVGQMGRDVQGTFSPDRFLTAYEKLSDQGKNVLFRSGGQSGLADALDDIAKVSGRFKDLNKFANPSGTAQNLNGTAAMMGLGYGILSGDIQTPLKVLGLMLGGRAVASMLAKPSIAASTARWARSYEDMVKNPTTPKVAVLTLASRNLATNLRDLGINAAPADFLKAIKGPVPAAAEGDQSPPVGVGHQ